MTGNDAKEQIDHINGNMDDNRWSNLREATALQNAWNKGIRCTNTSGSPGIYPMNTKRASSKKFRVLLTHKKGTKRFIGDFHTLAEAKAAYDTAFAKHRDITYKRDTTKG